MNSPFQTSIVTGEIYLLMASKRFKITSDFVMPNLQSALVCILVDYLIELACYSDYVQVWNYSMYCLVWIFYGFYRHIDTYKGSLLPAFYNQLCLMHILSNYILFIVIDQQPVHWSFAILFSFSSLNYLIQFNYTHFTPSEYLSLCGCRNI